VSYIYFNRLLGFGLPSFMDQVEAAFVTHDTAFRRRQTRGLLSEAFGAIDFSRGPFKKEDEQNLWERIEACEETEETVFIRVYPEVIRVHFITNWLQCHEEVRRLAQRFPLVRFQLDWSSYEENLTGRIVVCGDEVHGEAVLPMWHEGLYVMADHRNDLGPRDSFLATSCTDILQPINWEGFDLEETTERARDTSKTA